MELVGAVRTVVLTVTSQPQFNTRSVVASELVASTLSRRRSCWSRFVTQTNVEIIHKHTYI